MQLCGSLTPVPLSYPRRRARYTTMLLSSSTTWATASRWWPSWWPLSSFCGLGEKDSALAPGLEPDREGRCKGQLWVRGCLQGGGPVPSPQWQGVTGKQVPGPLEPQAGNFCPLTEPSPCQGTGWPKPRLACATLPAPGGTHLEGWEGGALWVRTWLGPELLPRLQPVVPGRGVGVGAERQARMLGGRHPAGNFLFSDPGATGKEGRCGRRGIPSKQEAPSSQSISCVAGPTIRALVWVGLW